MDNMLNNKARIIRNFNIIRIYQIIFQYIKLLFSRHHHKNPIRPCWTETNWNYMIKHPEIKMSPYLDNRTQKEVESDDFKDRLCTILLLIIVGIIEGFYRYLSN